MVFRNSNLARNFLQWRSHQGLIPSLSLEVVSTRLGPPIIKCNGEGDRVYQRAHIKESTDSSVGAAMHDNCLRE